MRQLLRINFSNPLMIAMVCLATRSAYAEQRPIVVELFTSEGCSSCPPAEKYLGELAQRPDVLALAYHVDYWDGLGWHDRFVIPEATPRQRQYARSLNLSSVYTPQMVIDGTGDFVGNDRAKIADALRDTRDGLPVNIVVQKGTIVIDLGLATHSASADVTLVAFERFAVSPIGRGENAGRTLKEYNIVRGIKQLGQYDGSHKTFYAEVSSLPKDATDVAVIIQGERLQSVLGAARVAVR